MKSKLILLVGLIVISTLWLNYSVQIEENTHKNIMTYHGCEKAEITYSYMGFSGKTRCVSGSNWTESQSDLHSQVDIRFYADRTMGILFTILLFMYFLSQ